MDMNRIEKTLAALKADRRAALIPFITTGDPDTATTLALMHAMVASGADVIELGVPFSDPMADGPVIQLANERALKHHTSLHDVFEVVRQFREADQSTCVVIMGYLNPIEVMGYEIFVAAAKAAGVDGMITVDLPPEEAVTLTALLDEANILPIYLLTPTTSDARAQLILDQCKGYVYYVSLKGVTGSNQLDIHDVSQKLAHMRSMTDLPIAVGFGISNADTAAQVAAVADGVVVGSMLVNRINELSGQPTGTITADIGARIAEMRDAMDHAIKTH